MQTLGLVIADLDARGDSGHDRELVCLAPPVVATLRWQLWRVDISA